jgi:hypothetical protein
MIQGNIDLSKFDDFHLKLEYSLHASPNSGFDLMDHNDQHRYKHDKIVACIARNISTDVLDYLNLKFNFINPVYSVQKMLPGMILPYHSDRYGYYLSNNSNITIDSVQRVIVFLEDWKSGHISEISGESHTNWKKGDWISWKSSTPHMAANLGHSDRYTLQITGIVK